MVDHNADWFVCRAGTQSGPFTQAQLLHLAQTGKLLPSDLLWKPGIPRWKAAHLVAGIFTPPQLPNTHSLPPPPLPTLHGHNKATQPSQRSQRNFILTHWRGDLPLWVSFWICGFLGFVAFGLIAFLVEKITASDEGYNPRAVFFMMVTIWGGGLLIWSWQLLGVWRAAAKYKADRLQKERHVFWGGVAQATTILGVLTLFPTIVTVTVPQLVETYRMAWLDDPSMPPYALRIMRNGTEIEITGGFKYGLTADFLRIARAAPQLRVVHLSSMGGRVGEAKKLSEAIRARRLKTYVPNQCFSACTLAFAGGNERWIRKGAVLGFHASSFVGMDDEIEPELDKEQRELFLSAGIDASFVDRALSTPHSDMWKPSISELLKANVVTAVAKGDEFAASGLNQDVNRDEMEAKLLEVIPPFKSLKERLPNEFASLVDDFHQGYVGGQTEQELIAATRKNFLPLIQRYLPLADDDVLVEYGKLLIEQYRALAATPEQCYLFAAGKGSDHDISGYIPPSLVQREMMLQSRIIETAAKRPDVTPNMTAHLWEEIGRRIDSKDLALLLEPNPPTTSYRRYCHASIAFLAEITSLPSSKAGLLLREIWIEAH